MDRRTSGTARVRYRLTGAAWALLSLASFSLLVWLFSDVDVQLAIATTIVAGVVIDAILAHRAVGPIVIDLRCPDEIRVGAPSTWTAQVIGWTRPITLTPLLTPFAPTLLVDHGQVGSLQWPPLSRGVVPFALVDVTATGPLGLVGAGRRHHVNLPAPVHVTPIPVTPRIRWPKTRAIGFGTVEGSPMGDDLFRSVRPYQFGDEQRRVHWKATAHHGELMVRESDGMGVVLVRLIVDLGLPGPSAEHAAGVAAGVAAAALDRGWGIELITLDAAHEVPRLERVGRAFGEAPLLAQPPLLPLPTISAPVRNAKEVRRRLSTTACGTPLVSGGGGGWRGLTCHVSPAGVEWS